MNTKTILLVEDDENDAFFVQRAFNKTGVVNPMQVVRDGQEAIKYLEGVEPYADRQHYPLPCIIITDLKMPRMDGLGFLRWLKDHDQFHQVPKLVLSSSGEDKDRQQAARLGACAYFVKPSEVNELVQVVLEINEDWISEHCPSKP
jgi:CheY-like chemotaxis protein